MTQPDNDYGILNDVSTNCRQFPLR